MTDSIYLHQEEQAFNYAKVAGQPGPEELA